MESQNEGRCSCGEVHDLEGVNKLTEYIWEGLRLYSKDTPIDRHVMANAFFQVCAYFFVNHSPQNIHGQVQEIENFCRALLDVAVHEAKPIQ
jgi:hypothetical protein